MLAFLILYIVLSMSNQRNLGEIHAAVLLFGNRIILAFILLHEGPILRTILRGIVVLIAAIAATLSSRTSASYRKERQ